MQFEIADAMSESVSNLVGIGLYTVSEASRLTGAPAQSIRRWLFGYTFQRRGGQDRSMPAVWHGDLRNIDKIKALSFLDLMEVRMVHAFRKHCVSWPAIREAAAEACERFNSPHPFTLKKFSTDGNRVFADLKEKGSVKLYDLNRKSYVMKPIVDKTLFAGIEFEHGQAARWFPDFARGAVVLDPERAFGRPILAQEGVPTEIISKAAVVEGSVEVAARWYEVPISAVNAAIAFENRLAA